MTTAAFAISGQLGENFSLTYAPQSTTGDTLASPVPFAVGTVTKGTDNSEWVFVLASGNIGEYDFVGINSGGTAASLTATTAAVAPAIGVAQVAILDTYYGWVCTKGGNGAVSYRGNVLLSCAKNVPLYATATAGYLDDAQGSSTWARILGANPLVSVGTVNTNTTFMFTWLKTDII